MPLSVGDETWRLIDALGLRVDADLLALDVRLTQGGEPTYVLAAEPDAPEWNTEATGDGKRPLAEKLRRRLADRFAAGGLLHDGQGRWYPGEALPRWSLDIFWRKDGDALWRDDALVAEFGRNYDYGINEARALMETVTAEARIAQQFILPVFEDPWPLLHEAHRLPVDVDPLQHDLRDPGARARLARLVCGDIARPTGFALPLRSREPGKARWTSGPWPLARDRLYLIPGSSPQGYRLPLDTLPASATDAVIRTALCIELRAGAIFVFMPPLEDPDDYLALLGIVERSAASTGLKVRVEGHDPPADPRLTVLRITPDPGVMEINMHPTASWIELSSSMQELELEARALGLTTVKHWFDGRLLATGGGSHITLGGPSLAQSPFLRRPDLLRSLLTYWQHHPALSYLFSGIFVGATSQAPRIDEARDDLLYELELAFEQLDSLSVKPGEPLDPQVLDGILRDLLVDITGNAHRAEFCLDKMCPPDAPGRRLGVLELRAFEMPPDWHTGMLQSLLVRALVARFWKKPYRHEFIRWSGALHDRFMLPYYLDADLQQVLRELEADGYAFAPEWFAPFFEFRFPLIGRMQHDDVELELRHALEPWLALGEQAASGASSRQVDSSLQRIQVKLKGSDPARYWLACNGRHLPLQPTGDGGESVCAVRFRAWNLHQMVHPTIRAHVPLTFEMVNASRGTVVAGCRYHVGRPDGGDYEGRPADAGEAARRRTERFEAFVPDRTQVAPAAHPAGHSAGLTLDLRRLPA